MSKVIIIAEAGVNHNGSLKLAKELIDVAAVAGADYVKFQTFVAEKSISKHAKKAEYQIVNTNNNIESQLEMVKKLELSKEDHLELIEYCKLRKIKFLSTAFDDVSVELLDQFGLDYFKIPSGEITNLPYLRNIASRKKKIILSTGMCYLEEVERALNVLTSEKVPLSDITVLHCNTEYPTPFEDVNLNAMINIRDTFNVQVGYSDHTLGIEIPIAAVALGARVIEKHFTISKQLPGPDHKASLEPIELNLMVQGIRKIEKALGDGFKKPSPSEIKNISIARKSIVASRNIKKGEVFSADNLTTKRPGHGISPMEWDRIINSKAEKDYKEDDLI